MVASILKREKTYSKNMTQLTYIHKVPAKDGECGCGGSCGCGNGSRK